MGAFDSQLSQLNENIKDGSWFSMHIVVNKWYYIYTVDIYRDISYKDFFSSNQGNFHLRL